MNKYLIQKSIKKYNGKNKISKNVFKQINKYKIKKQYNLKYNKK